ncbi:MAG: AAA family ATPase [Gemmatimonadota bacterium]|nr:AAA family ATPase [Gemmatimonadota bacterium]
MAAPESSSNGRIGDRSANASATELDCSSEGLFSSVSPAVVATCRRMGAFAGYPEPSDGVLWEGNLLPFLADLLRLGGSWRALSDFVLWDFSRGGAGEVVIDRVYAAFPGARTEGGVTQDVMLHAEGVFEVCLGAIRAVIWSGRRYFPDYRARIQSLLIMAANRDQSVQLLQRVLAERDKASLLLWGGFNKAASPALVTEAEVVLPVELKQDLLIELDNFWRVAGLARAEGIVHRRGVLLVGPPGTGKTQLVRHLITRYRDVVESHLFVAGRRGQDGDPFGVMLGHIRNTRRPALVILEDIDRLEASGAVTAEYLLNSLDGLLESPVPILWVATSNDPSGLDGNLLNRPGRFDRTVVFDLPDLAMRVQLIELQLGGRVSSGFVSEAAAAAEGLGGAHIREACTAARLANLDGGEPLGEALLRQVQRVQDHQRRAKDFGRSLTGARAGFGQ